MGLALYFRVVKLLSDNQSPLRDVNPKPFEYEAVVPTTRPQRLVP